MEATVKKNKRKALYFTIYRALTYDWFFIYAIDSIYYNEIKLMSFSMISLLVTVASLTYIIVCVPMVRVARKIGTVQSSRIGTALFLIAAIMLLFEPWTIFLSQIVFMVGLALKNSSETKILKDNLKMYGLSKDFVKYGSITQFTWAFVNTISTVCAGFLYTVWPYAPIVACTIILVIALIMSIFIHNEKEIYKKQNNLPAHEVKLEKFEFFKLFKYHTTWILLFFSMIFYGLISGSMDITKMAFQELQFTATTITIVCAIAYFLRAFTAYGFSFIYKKMRFKSIYLILAVSAGGILMIGLGGLLASGTTALIIMAVGTVLLYSSRDPYNLFRDNFVMNSNGLTKRQTLLQITYVGNYAGRLIVSFSISYILLSQTVAVTYLIILALVPFAILISLLLHRKQKVNKYDVFY